MKSHIRTIVTPKILFYGIEPGSPKGQELAELCRAQNILWEEVPSHRLGDPLGLLAGLSGFSPSAAPWEKETPAREAMVFCGLEQEDLDAYLSGYAAAEIEKIPLKAVLTPHNVAWTAEQLYEELMEEHRSFAQRRQ